MKNEYNKDGNNDDYISVKASEEILAADLENYEWQ